MKKVMKNRQRKKTENKRKSVRKERKTFTNPIYIKSGAVKC